MVARRDHNWELAAYYLRDCTPYVSEPLASLLYTMASDANVHENDVRGAIEDIRRELESK